MGLKVIDGTPTVMAKYLREKECKCENPNHEGENGEGSWWLKDPEWKYWCPNCTKKWWKEKLKDAFQQRSEKEKEEHWEDEALTIGD